MTVPEVFATGTSDVGRVREANEDDLFVGTSVVAVADGMGGHLAGEVASATALEPVRALDGKVFADPESALSSLRDAVVEANATVSRMAADEPTYRGMGTTLTAAMVEGRRLHLAHVGDSRAYLLRQGSFSQVTDDHTLVQHLIDEGQITVEEAATHPQRSIITRAIGVSPEVDVDAVSLDLEEGDQLLLCSDGLTGVVPDERIAEELRSGDAPQATLDRLVEAANEAGGPDNITIVLLRYGDPQAPPAATTASSAPVRIGTRDESSGEDWAGRLGAYGALTRDGATVGGTDAEESAGIGRVLGRATAVLLGVALLAGLAFLGGRFLLDRSFYVGLEGDDVVIYQGVDAEVGPFTLNRVAERTEVTVDELAPFYVSVLEDGAQATDLQDARRIVDGAPRREEPDDDPAEADDVPSSADPDDGADDEDDEDGPS